MSIREQLRGVIRRSRDMADMAGDNDDNEYSVLESERRVSPRSGVSPTGRSLQDLMKEQQSHMWAAEERHRKEYLPMLGEAILAVGGDPNAPAKSGGSGAASYAHLSGSLSSPSRPSSPSALPKGGSGEGSGVGTPRTPPAGSRVNPILNRSPSQSPESTSLGLMLMRPGGSLALSSEVDEGATQHQRPEVAETVYTYPNRSSMSNSASASGSGRRPSSPIASDPPPPPYNGASSEDEMTGDQRRDTSNNKSHLKNTNSTVEYIRGDNNQNQNHSKVPTAATLSSGESDRGCSPCVSYRSATPPPPKLLSTTPPPTPKGSFNNLRKAAAEVVSSKPPSCGNDLQSADSTVSGPPCDDLDSTQRPNNTHSAASAKSSVVSSSAAAVNNAKGGRREGVGEVNSVNLLPRSTARPPTSSSPSTSPPAHRSPRAVSGGGGVLRPTSGSSSASIGGTGPSMSLKEMMLDRNKDLHDAERKRSEEYIPLRDAAIKEIEKLEAEGRWRSK